MEPTSSSPSPVLSPAERLRRSEEAGRALVSGWETSGMTMRAYAQQVGVRAQRLSYWRLRLRRPGVPAAADTDFVEITPRVVPSHLGVVVELPGGVYLRIEAGFDPQVLRAVVTALSDVGAARC